MPLEARKETYVTETERGPRGTQRGAGGYSGKVPLDWRRRRCGSNVRRSSCGAAPRIPRIRKTFVLHVILFVIAITLFSTIRVTNPGHTRVIQLFGKYLGTSRRTGLNVVPPFTTSHRISVRVRNFETQIIKVNDLNSNPLNIAAIIVWQVADTARATFAVENVNQFIHSQAESALRHVATTHPYEGGSHGIDSLSGSTDLVSNELAREVAARVQVAGIQVLEARISALSYAPEIAQSMLQRQQAAAVVDARETIVEGAVSMVQDALRELETRDIVNLDPDRRATMVSNLLVVLCSDSATQPVVNAGNL